MELKDVFGEIEADGAHLVHERLLEWALTPPLWHAEAVGGVHTIRLVEHGPETLRRLKLGCVARQMEQPDPVWNAKVRFGVPAGLVQHEHDAALAAGRAFLGEGRKERGEERLGDAGGEIPDRLARAGLGEGRDVKSLVAVGAERDRALALGRPDAAQDRLQAEAVAWISPRAWPPSDDAGAASGSTTRSRAEPPSPVGHRPRQARARRPSSAPLSHSSTARHRAADRPGGRASAPTGPA